MNEYNAPATGGELFEGQTIGVDQLGDYDKGGGEFILLPEGDHYFTVTQIERSRYTPKPSSKIGSCIQVTVTLRVTDPQIGKPVDLKHNLYMWSSTLGMIAQYYDAIGIHKKGMPLTFDWRPETHIGKTGKLKIAHRSYKASNGEDRVTNDIKKLYPKEDTAPQQSAPAWQKGY